MEKSLYCFPLTSPFHVFRIKTCWTAHPLPPSPSFVILLLATGPQSCHAGCLPGMGWMTPMADELKVSCMFLKMPLEHKPFPATTARASHYLCFVHHPTPFLEKLGSLFCPQPMHLRVSYFIAIKPPLISPCPILFFAALFFLLSILRELVSWFLSSSFFSMARL